MRDYEANPVLQIFDASRTTGTALNSLRVWTGKWGCRNPHHKHFCKEYAEMCRSIEEAEGD